MKINEIQQGLKDINYIASKDIVFATAGAINEQIPLFIEGAPGAGKTALAKAVAELLGCKLIRVQFYEGLTADKILYDYDYQRQLLTIESIKSVLSKELADKNIEQAIDLTKDINFYGKSFLIQRPILESIMSQERCVLLLDEIDKASEEIEYTLLQFLDEFSISIPQYGTITAKEDKRPIVFLTSNNYRDLSDALKRRCNYLYIQNKTKEEMIEILKMKASISPTLANGVASCLIAIQNLQLKQMPSIDEGIKWASYLQKNFGEIDENTIDYTICMLAKNQDDVEIIKKSKIIQGNLIE